MQIEVTNFFVSQVVPELYAKKHISKTGRYVFLLLTVSSKLHHELHFHFSAQIQNPIPFDYVQFFVIFWYFLAMRHLNDKVKA